MTEPSKLLRLIGLALVAGGLFFSLAGVGVFYSSYSFLQSGSRAEGEVFDFARRRSSTTSSATSNLLYYPIVRFQTADGQRITSESLHGSSPAAYSVGEKVTVIYDPQAPQQASIQGFWEQWALPTIATGLGTVILCAGAVILWLPHRTRRRIDWLRQNGLKIIANVERIEINRSVTVNQQHPYQILCKGIDPASGQTRDFRSENFYFDPAPLLHEQALEVWVDPQKPKRYWVDTEFLKERNRAGARLSSRPV